MRWRKFPYVSFLAKRWVPYSPPWSHVVDPSSAINLSWNINCSWLGHLGLDIVPGPQEDFQTWSLKDLREQVGKCRWNGTHTGSWLTTIHEWGSITQRHIRSRIEKHAFIPKEVVALNCWQDTCCGNQTCLVGKGEIKGLFCWWQVSCTNCEQKKIFYWFYF